MTDAELQAIRERCEKASELPWKPWQSSDGAIHRLYGQYQRGVCEMTNPSQGQQLADLDFIAAARSDVPALLAEVERLKTALLAEREACAAICDKVQTDADYRHSQNADPSEGSDGAAVTAKLIRERGKP